MNINTEFHAAEKEVAKEIHAVIDDAEAVAKRVEAAVTQWVRTHLHNSPVSRNTEAMNHITASTPALVNAVTEAIKAP